jgi:alpha,alpha-trehalase
MRFRTEESNIAASEFIHLDLNCILYDAEVKLSEMLEVVGRCEESNEYKNKALIRKELMNQYFLTEDGIYMDYNFVTEKHGSILSNASLYPYIFGISEDSKGAKKVLEQLELEHGVTCAAYRGDDIYYQWDYPLMWGEMHILDYVGLVNVHLLEDAKRIKDKFMATVEHVFEKEHKLFEKYDGTTGEISNCEYEAPEMLGWTAAAYLYFNNIKD